MGNANKNNVLNTNTIIVMVSVYRIYARITSTLIKMADANKINARSTTSS